VPDRAHDFSELGEDEPRRLSQLGLFLRPHRIVPVLSPPFLDEEIGAGRQQPPDDR
jgi:hypothetical protein